MIPVKMSQAGYTTHLAGKWHQGSSNRQYLPINRGFDTSIGYLSGAEEHFNQTGGCGDMYGSLSYIYKITPTHSPTHISIFM